MQIYAIRVFVKDWDAACDFYENRLGLPLRFASPDMGWAEFNAGGPSLAVERAGEDHAELVGRFLGVSLMVEDLEAVHRQLADQGVTFTMGPTPQPWGGRVAHLQDPDGNVLTLLEY